MDFVRVIFSRKGFDSQSGGVPSPLIGGRPVSLPIPTRQPTATSFESLGGRVAELACELTKGRIAPETPCHLDPDLDESLRPRHAGWRGAFGQVGASQAHLANRGISEGDLFLFWGLFRPAVRNECWEFRDHAEHRIYGWLQVDKIVRVGSDPSSTLAACPWLADHPHVREGWSESNTIYVAAESLVLEGRSVGVPGFGMFEFGTRLTRPGAIRPTEWSVPSWLDPTQGGVGMTYHPVSRWEGNGLLRAVSRGQEFVADIEGRADAHSWLRQLFKR